MHYLILIGSGIIMGLIAAVPIGPVNLICVRRTFAFGPLNGFVSGLGAALGDGVFAADLPARQLARLYGTNHYIVSYINPVLLPTFRDHKLESDRLRPLMRMLKGSLRNLAKSTDAKLGKYFPESSLGVVNKVIHDLLSQDYVGDVNIAPHRRFVSPLKLVSPHTNEEIAEVILEGERQTWPRVEMIRNSSRISRTLDEILRRAGEPGLVAS